MKRRDFMIRTGIAAATVSLAGGAWADGSPSRHFIHEHDGAAGPVLNLKGLKIGAGAPKIIASITGRDPEEVMRQARAIGTSGQVDMAELRLDYLPETIGHRALDALVNQVVLTLNGKPLLATFRSKKEGGERALSDIDYFSLYSTLLESAPIDLLDIEMMKPEAQVRDSIAKAHAMGVAVVLSNHDFESTPAHTTIIERLQRQQALGGDILKMAAMPKSPADVLALMLATQEMHASHAQRPLLTMSMGPMGITSRIAGQLTGSSLTYASMGSASAPGQMDAGAVRTVLEIMEKGSEA
ncbi:type I 3-dehydroquinate dehydratase [Pseudomonas coleopterorum]|uniref:type I 3-dehydroquinate dehydratase n=1 Tax=Pseudomonas coleopterorum TaxID=1605838 RepID=UPI00177AC0A7|nr:type I 3-dehydroquinate dehydratase [Pseudomonas coleopterorum]MBD8480390.1 type I 3-dehydroquinate dehydratase [Pseudomonas coleopterorum]